MKACASFEFASGALEQTKFGVPACFVVLDSFSSGNNARIWMTMQEDFLACSLVGCCERVSLARVLAKTCSL